MYGSFPEGFGLGQFGELGGRRDHHVYQGDCDDYEEDVEEVGHVGFEVCYCTLTVALFLVVHPHLGLFGTVGNKRHRCHVQRRHQEASANGAISGKC